jgi:hypothetical protein
MAAQDIGVWLSTKAALSDLEGVDLFAVDPDAEVGRVDAGDTGGGGGGSGGDGVLDGGDAESVFVLGVDGGDAASTYGVGSTDRQVQIRRDTAADWAATNPVLAAGELGTDQLQLKLGDGATAWNTLAGVAVRDEKYDAVARSGLSTANTAAANSTAFADALTKVGAVAGGKLYVRPGTYSYNTTLALSYSDFELCGDGPRTATILNYTGASHGISVTGLYDVKLRHFKLQSTTGIDGIRIGHSATIAWRHLLEDLYVINWPGNGIHADHVEHLTGNMIHVEDVGGNGFKLDNAFGSSMACEFYSCRAQDCASEGWFVDGWINGTFNIESLNNGGLAMFRTGYVYACNLFLDVEDTTNAQTKTGLRFIGERSNIKVMTFGLAVGVYLNSSPGNFIEPSRFSNTVKPIEDAGSNTRLVIFDGGNLSGSTYASAVGEVSFLGRKTLKGNTASRPTLTTYDVGHMHMDTTLDADGKPIWWTGTAWVDATGATV